MAETSISQLQAYIDRLNAGDPAARDLLITHALDRLRRLVRKMLPATDRLRRFEDTDDVLHNAVMRLLRALEDVPLKSVAHFLGLAAWHIRNVLKDLARHYYGPAGSGAHRARPLPAQASAAMSESAQEESDSTYDPRRLAAWRDFHEQVELLPKEEKEVFDLHWYQGLTQAETAGVLGVSVPTVKRRWMAARLRLQEVVGNLPQ